jgi:hypothetical protein
MYSKCNRLIFKPDVGEWTVSQQSVHSEQRAVDGEVSRPSEFVE